MARINRKQALVIGAAVAATGAAIVATRRKSHYDEPPFMDDVSSIPDDFQSAVSEIERELPKEAERTMDQLTQDESTAKDRLPQT
jgi:hypothetical protein